MALADSAGNAQFLDKLTQLHDHKGTLIVFWNEVPASERGYFARAWASKVGDGTEIGTRMLSGAMLTMDDHHGFGAGPGQPGAVQPRCSFRHGAAARLRRWPAGACRNRCRPPAGCCWRSGGSGVVPETLALPLALCAADCRRAWKPRALWETRGQGALAPRHGAAAGPGHRAVPAVLLIDENGLRALAAR
jgi:hypothetical protein